MQGDQQQVADIFLDLGLLPAKVTVKDAVRLLAIELPIVQGAACRALYRPRHRPMDIFWFIPTHGDGRYLGTSTGGRATTSAYLRQIAQAADELGYDGVLMPTGRSLRGRLGGGRGLIPLTERLKFLVAVRPGLMSPTLAARMAATFDRLSDGRLLINVVDRRRPGRAGRRRPASSPMTSATR